MNTVKAATLLAIVTALAGCAGPGSMQTDGVARQCKINETVVCRDGTASRLEGRSNDGRFCTCEPNIDGVY